jgi:radical SAM superfamily enzyme YgiQ (UPF0313 family)
LSSEYEEKEPVRAARKVLMVYPKTPTTYWSFDHALWFIGKKTSIPPLGLMTVAAMLPPEYETRLVDMNVEPLRRADIEAADLVFLSAMMVQRRSFDEVVRLCRECGKPVVAGGPYPICSWQEIEGVDHFVLDEAEITLPRFLADLEAGRPQKMYRAEEKPDISRTPPPRFDLIDVSAYDSMPLQFSRGCPYSCEFCDIIEMFGRVQRTKTPQQFLREVEAVYATGFRGPLFLVDDNFVGNHRRARDLLRAMVGWQREHGFPFTFGTEASIDLARDDELLDLMAEAGCTMVFVGIETPDRETLAYTQKGQNLKVSILESVEKIQRRGIEVTGGFIVGFDTDPPDIFDRQIDFIQQAGIPAAMVGMLTAMPNTQLWRRLEKEGRLYSTGSGNNTHTLGTNFRPRMPAETLNAGYQRVLAELYSPRQYFERCLTLIRRLPDRTRVVRSTSWVEVRAFLRSILRQGFSPYGLHYLHFLLEALRARPRLFPDAVAFAIKGYHFFRITAAILRASEFSTRLRRTHLSLQARVAQVVGSREQALALSMERAVLRLQVRLRRKYGGFSRDIQQHLADAFAEFERHCQGWLAQLRLVT